MGYENRDYFRDGTYTRGGGGDFMPEAPMCKKILIVTAVIFVAQMFLTRPARLADFQHIKDQYQQEIEDIKSFGTDKSVGGTEESVDEDTRPDQRQLPDWEQAGPKISIVQEWLKLDTEKVLKQGQVWRLVTNAFCHDRFGVWHIVFNMLFLVWFGQFVESTYGSKEFLCFYLAAAVVASLAFIGLELFTGERHGAIGASGAVMGVVCVFAMWNPHHTIRMYFLFPIQIRYLLLLYVIFDLHPVLLSLSGTVTHTGVAHAAHLGGLLFGYLYYKNNWRLLPFWNIVSQTASGMLGRGALTRRSTLRIYDDASNRRSELLKDRSEKTQSDLRFDDQLDEVLRKISESGQDSLTEREQKILLLGSKRYRKQ